MTSSSTLRFILNNNKSDEFPIFSDKFTNSPKPLFGILDSTDHEVESEPEFGVHYSAEYEVESEPEYEAHHSAEYGVE
jgi:hypothetical protein